MRAVDAHGQAHVAAIDHLVAELLGVARRAIADADDPVLPPLRLEHRQVAHDEAQAEERLRDHAIAVVALGPVADGAGRAEPEADEGRALQRQRARQPPLGDGAERQVRRRHAEDLRRQVLVAAEEPPEPAVVVAQLVAVADEQAADRDVLDGVGGRARVGHRGELEEEEVERARVLVAGLAGQPVGHVEVQASVLLPDDGRQVRVGHARGESGAQPQADIDGGIAARKDRLEPLAEDEAVEAEARREHGRAQLAPEPRRLAAAFQQQACHSEHGLAHEGAADAARHVVVDRGQRRLAGRLPDVATQERVAGRLPVAEAGGAGEPVIDASLVRMPDLIDAERVLVELRRRREILPDGVAVDAVRLRIVDPVERAERGDEPDDLGGGNDVALAGPRIPVQHVALRALVRRARRRCQERDEQSGHDGADAPPADHRPSARKDACATVHRSSSSGSGSWAMPGTREVATSPRPLSTSSGLPRSLR